MSWVATRQDLVTFGGLPASAYAADARQLPAIHVAQSTFELPSNGFNVGVPVRFAARAGATLPTGIDPLVWYTSAPTVDPDFFTILNGSTPVVLTDGGVGPIFVVENVWPKIDDRLGSRTSWVVANAKAYKGPWTTPPGWAPQVVAALVAADCAPWLRLPERYPLELLEKRYDEAQTFIRTKLDDGIPYPDGSGPVDATPALADNAPRAWGRAPVGWGKRTL